ncbi:MAG: hypothetical protein AV945_gp20 [Phormidium phage MIS-PhV1B]|uniref:hypothetical protein n=1 Tax=Phormidium phage MIS-PhV1B TaxID=1391456 RepID=UPI0003C96C03|nr:MAG: hypothetical protein AV945_gp20 [Phormidium phage MIS-PhV1B]AGZ61827.1 MAG: hypothetical protein [Phormidium phage MIS-PhV1B]
MYSRIGFSVLCRIGYAHTIILPNFGLKSNKKLMYVVRVVHNEVISINFLSL